MNKITLKDLIDLYNFRNYRNDLDLESLKYDTHTIRIYLGNSISSHNYVEFGVYDFGEEEYKEDLYKEFLNEEVLKRKVESMYQDYELNIFCVLLGDKENE